MPETTAPRSGLYRMASNAVGDLPTFLLTERDRGISYRAIAAKLVAQGVETNGETVRLWAIRAGVK